MDLHFTLNGTEVYTDLKKNMRALDFLREELRITSVKEGCGEGECGACTILLDGMAVCSCILFATDLMDKKVTTVEGLGSEQNLHPIQQAFYESGAVQCGFCTPGLILSVKALLDQNPEPTDEEIKKGLEGNLCRCTGYIKIVEAVRLAIDLLKTRSNMI